MIANGTNLNYIIGIIKNDGDNMQIDYISDTHLDHRINPKIPIDLLQKKVHALIKRILPEEGASNIPSRRRGYWGD